MKRPLDKLWAKITALILLSILVPVCLLSGVGIVYLIDSNTYADGGDEAISSAVTTNHFWSKMQEACDYYQSILDDDDGSILYYQNEFGEENSNFYFAIRDEGGKTLLQNYAGNDSMYTYTDSRSVSYNYRSYEESKSFASNYERDQYIETCYDTYWSLTCIETWEEYDEYGNAEFFLAVEYIIADQVTVYVTGNVKSDMTAVDEFYISTYWMSLLVSARYTIIALCVISLLACIFLFVFLVCSAGHKEGIDGIHLNWMSRIPFDLYLVIIVAAVATLVVMIADAAYNGVVWYVTAFIIGSIAILLLVMSTFITFAARTKAGRWWENNIIYRLLRLFWRLVRGLKNGLVYILRSLPLYWKTGLIWGALSIVELICLFGFRYDGDVLLFLFVLEKMILTTVIIIAVINMRVLQKGGREIAAGNLAYTVDLRHMLWDFKKHGENLNCIGVGMQRAVDEQMKSERLKTELITNVSHDIKTPLTSIINYVDLLKHDGPESEGFSEYIDVLERQSKRLKKLSEDVVEASKASSGGLAIELDNVDVNLLLSQAIGEYSDRMNEAGLSTVVSTALESPEVLADGKLLWRVFDNLLSNICKYTLKGTRVYIASEVVDSEVRISFKNISSYALNISSDELMERFIRGDSSRATEGSGLGLSIARSLTQLQGGSLNLSIDGDLFKATLIFPRH